MKSKKYNAIILILLIILLLLLVFGGIVFIYFNSSKTTSTTTASIYQKQETEEEKQAKLQREAEEKARKEQEEKERKEQEAKQKEQEKQNFIASCKAYTYEQMARNPEKFKGTNVKLTGEVIQALYSDNSIDLRVNITKEGTYSTWYTDTVYVVYYPEIGEDKILEDDIITIYGTSLGDYTYTSTIGASVTLPLIYGKYIIVNQ